MSGVSERQIFFDWVYSKYDIILMQIYVYSPEEETYFLFTLENQNACGCEAQAVVRGVLALQINVTSLVNVITTRRNVIWSMT